MAFTRDYSAMFTKIQENQVKNKEFAEKKNKPKKNFNIEGEFKPKYDSNGEAVIDLRFLPSVASEAMPYVESWEHFFENGPTAKQKFWSCKCRGILGAGSNECPVCKENRRIYKHFEGDKAKGKKEAQSYTHSVKKNYYSNVYIMQNDNDPETEGRVFVLKYGKQIFDWINELSEATSNKEVGIMPAVNAFDVSRSVTFHWVIKKDATGRPKFDGSKFYRAEKMVTPLCDKNDRILTESELEDIEKALHPLEPLVPKLEEIPSYDNIVKWHNLQCGTQFGWYEDDEVHEDEVVKGPDGKFDLLKNILASGNTPVQTPTFTPKTTPEPSFTNTTINSDTKKSIDEMVSNAYASSNAVAGVVGGDDEDEDEDETPAPSPKPQSTEGMSEKQKAFWEKFGKMKK